jgi:hypothetical protein
MLSVKIAYPVQIFGRCLSMIIKPGITFSLRPKRPILLCEFFTIFSDGCIGNQAASILTAFRTRTDDYLI